MLEDVFCDMDPDQGIDDEYKHYNDKVFTWKMLRCIAENDLTKFNNNAKSYEIEQLALEYVRISKLTFRLVDPAI